MLSIKVALEISFKVIYKVLKGFLVLTTCLTYWGRSSVTYSVVRQIECMDIRKSTVMFSNIDVT